MASIWGSAAGTPTGTYRVPVDVSSSGAPTHLTVQQLADLETSIGKTHNALGSIGTNTTIDLSLGGFVSATITGNLTFTFSNPPAGTNGCEFTLVLTNGGAFAVTWPGSVTWAGATAPTLTASGTDVLHFATGNAGTNWYGWHERDELSTAGGSSGQFQYNNATLFDGANLWREDANTIAQRNSTTAQTHYVYDTYTDTSNYVRLALIGGAAGSWSQYAVQSAGTSGGNWALAVSPMGNGALSAHVPDSASAGGNARGAFSTDWQRSRGSASQAATGFGAVLGGGATNTSSANYSTVGGGTVNIASAAGATVAGGDTNTAAGINSWIPGGKYGTTRGLTGAYAYASDRRSASGDAQVIGQPVRQSTSATSIAYLTTDAGAPSATNCMVLPINSGCQFEGRLTAVHAAGAAVGGWKVEGIARRGASGASTVVDVVVTAFTADAAIGVPTITVTGGAGGELLFAVTPANSTPTYWVGRLELIQGA